MNGYHFLWCLMLVVLAGCYPGPRYKKPTTSVPVTYSAQSGASSEATDLSTWWHYFNDNYLNELITQALTTNYDLRLAIEKIEETRTSYQIRAARLFPDIGVTSIVQRMRESNLIQDPTLAQDKTFSFFQLSFDATWELDIWGKLQRAKSAAYAEYQAQIETMRDVYIMLVSDVARAYIDIRSLQKKIDYVTALIEVDKRLLLLLQDRYHAGITSELPIPEQVRALAIAQAQLITLQEGLGQAINRLAVLLGVNPEDFVLACGEHEVPVAHEPLAVGLPSDLLRRRPDIRRAERVLAAATDRVGQAVAEWFPSFQLLASVGGQTNQANKLFSHSGLAWLIGPAIKWPLLSFGRVEFNIQEKRSVMRQALLSYAKTVLTALADVEFWLISYFATQERLHVVQEKLTAVVRERDLVCMLWQAGLDDELRYLLNEKQNVHIMLEVIDVQRSLSLALVSLYKALGGGW